MTTAEKKAELDANGQPWPTCECHGLPCSWQRNPANSGGGSFRCREVRRQWQNSRRAERRNAGICIHCGRTADTTTMCQTCADIHADRMARPKERFQHQIAVIRHRSKVKQREGFQSTGAGLAAFAAWTEERT